MDGTIIHFFHREREREAERKSQKKTRVLFDLRKKDAAFC